ncbi:hypothetical protein DNTS_029477 [Danionella cerebrum]|uniref:Fibulin-2 domain-containing protein n=1 Tax=Danionella cerebrum TaxID=2873325 RepID=A0A553QNF0_9TELE|nr:hypothetical protein DNTS_029477 [Danionella translucida]
MCEGYQYYDCISAGFGFGKVPEGESYFVDFGSTECSCPQGGGRISCHFIPCPEIPANCIEVSEPADGCVQCEQVGCIHKEEKYQAGHTFKIDPCQVCHCPNGGGDLMCYPVPNCDADHASKPFQMTTEESTPERRYRDSIQHLFNPKGSRGLFNKHLPLHIDNNPPFKMRIRNAEEKEEEEEEDYDYPPNDYSAQYLHGLTAPTESSIISVSLSDNFAPRQPVHKGSNQELREIFGIHKSTTDKPLIPFYQGSTERMRVVIHKDKPENDLNSPVEYKTDREQFSLPVETVNKVGSSPHKDTSEIQSFSLYKDNSDQEALIDDEQLEFSFESPYEDTDSSQEDTTYNDTKSPVTTEPTTSLLLETTTSFQTAWDGELESQILSHLPHSVEEDFSKEEETSTIGPAEEKDAFNETVNKYSIDPINGYHNELNLGSSDPVLQSVTSPTETLAEHETPETQLEEEDGTPPEQSLDYKEYPTEQAKSVDNQSHENEYLQTELERKLQEDLFSPVNYSPTSIPSKEQSNSLFNFREEKADNTLRNHVKEEDDHMAG